LKVHYDNLKTDLGTDQMRPIKRLYKQDSDTPAYMRSSIDLTLPEVKKVNLQ